MLNTIVCHGLTLTRQDDATGTRGTARLHKGGACGPDPSQGNINGSSETGSPELGSTHSQGAAASPQAAAALSSKASEDRTESGGHGSRASDGQPSGSQSPHQEQEGARLASAPSSAEGSEDHGSGETRTHSILRDLCQPALRKNMPCLHRLPSCAANQGYPPQVEQ